MRLGLEAGELTRQLALQLGITGVPISAAELVERGPVSVTAELGSLQVCQIGAFGYNPLSPDLDARRTQADIIRRAIPLAGEVGCPYIVINGGNAHPSGFGGHDPASHTPDAIGKIALELEPLVRLAEAHGARISIEPYLKTAINSTERFNALWSKIGSPALVANVDVTSLYDYADFTNPRRLIAETCEGLAPHYGLVHIKDIGLREGFHIHMDLAPLGTSPTDWSDVLARVSEHLPHDSWVVLEHVQSEAEAVASLAFIKRAASTRKIELR